MGGMGFIENNRALCMLSVLINTHLCMAAKKHGVQRFFYASSACVYNADKQTDPDVTALKEADAYPAHARRRLRLGKTFQRTHVPPFPRRFRPGHPRRPLSTMFMAPTALTMADAKKPPPPSAAKSSRPSSPANTKSKSGATATRPAASCILTTACKGTQAILASDILEPINLGSSELVSINQLVDIVEGIAGIKLKRSYNLKAPKGVNGRNSDNTLIKKYLGWEPSVRLRDGLEKTYKWILGEMTKK